MSTKYFYFDGDAAKAFSGESYTDGNPVEWTMLERQTLAIQGWHNVTQAQRNSITAKLLASGWLEGEQSKPD